MIERPLSTPPPAAPAPASAAAEVGPRPDILARVGVAVFALAAAAALALAVAPSAWAGIPDAAELEAGRAKLNELKEKERALRAELDDVITSIPTARADIKVAQSNCNKKTDQWREAQDVARRGASWDDIVDLENAAKARTAACQFVADERNALGELTAKRSELQRDWRLAAWRANMFGEELRVNSTRAAQTASVGVYLSSTCAIVGPPACPSMKDLIPLDESLPHTGAFERDNATGQWGRGPSPMHNVHHLYHGDETPRLIVDPPARLSKDLRMITIAVDVPPTPPIATHVEIDDHDLPHAVPFLHTRLADRYCTEAIVAAGGPALWRERLLDTAAWMRSGCKIASNITTSAWLSFPVEYYDRWQSPAIARQLDFEHKEQVCHGAYGACKEWPPPPPPHLQWPHLARLNEGARAPPRVVKGDLGGPLPCPLPALRPLVLDPPRPQADPVRRVRQPLSGGGMDDHSGGRRA